MREFFIIAWLTLFLCAVCGIHYYINTRTLRRSKSIPHPINRADLQEEDKYNLKRFLEAQEGVYEIALEEIKSGCKRSHWMWFIFPQLYGLGYTVTAQYYAIKSIEEAKEYAKHPMLGLRLREITQAVLDSTELDIDQLLGYPDDLKLKSCMTLFYLVTGEELFQKVLEKYFGGEMCEFTVNIYNATTKGDEK